MNQISVLLQEAREERKLKVDDAVKELRVRKPYIEALERGDFEFLEAENVYLIGLVKSYSEWMGLNSSEVISMLKAGSSSHFNVKKNIAAASESAFFTFDTAIVRPDARVFLIVVLLSIIVYTFWHKFQKPETVDISANIAETHPPVAFAEGISENPHNFMLMARERTPIRIFNADGSVSLRQMEEGEVIFIGNDQKTMVVADKPNVVDVFVDDANNTFLGTLENIASY